MGRISSSVGLISNIPTSELVEQLLSLEARPVQLAEASIKLHTAEQTAMVDLTAKLVALGASSSTWTNSQILDARSVSSSNSALIKAVVQNTAVAGVQRFRAIRQVATQQSITGGFASADSTPVGAGTVTVKLGGFVKPATSLEQLNGGQGVRRGSILITDRSGVTATVDLKTALSVDDVLKAINETTGIRVKATTDGDSILLTDETGAAVTNLTVQEVAGGTTAAGLGILGNSAGGTTLTGSDIVSLSGILNLGFLNDQNGVHNVAGLDDFQILLKDGDTLDVNLDNVTNIQGVLDAINLDAQNGGQVTASIDPAGDRLRLTDNTGGGGTLTVTALNGSTAAKDLGILGTEQAGGVLAGGRVLAGLNTVLLSSLNGGSGISNRGQVQFTDRSGATATVNFANSESLDDVIAAINGAGLGLTAAVNAAQNGIQITDTTGATAGNLIIADVAAGTLAADLGLDTNAALTTVNSGDQNLRYISQNTKLEKLRGGQGITNGKFRITDSAGGVAVIDLTGAKTVGDLLVKLNTAGNDVSARLNDTGDGILLTDIAGGVGSLTVAEENGGQTASQLRLLGSSAGGAIDGAYRYEVTLDADDTLSDAITKLTATGAPLTASLLNDGSSVQPYHLLLASKRSGQGGRLLIDVGTTGLGLSKITDGADAVLEVGSGGSGQLLVTSTTNTFANVLPGLTLDIFGASSEVVTVTVAADDAPLAATVKQFVDNFNKVRASIKTITAFNSETTTRGILQGDRTVLQVEASLFNLISRSAGSADNPVRRLAQLGITVKDGQLTLNESTLNQAISENPAAVKNFFQAETTGMADQLENIVDGFTDVVSGSITIRAKSLDDKIDTLEQRVTDLNELLDGKRQRLLRQFLEMEKALAQIQNQQDAISRLTLISSPKKN
jgi:flagellar hook-associated protein 2